MMSTAQRGRAAARRALEQEGFSVREDETRRNRLLARRGNVSLTIWVATRKGFNYPFWAETDWHPNDTTHACLVRIDERSGAPEVYVIPTTVWRTPDPVFVSRDYIAKPSPPE